MRLIRQSNPPLLEWLRSPLLYKELFSTAERLRKLGREFFSPISVMYHYLNMTKLNHAQYLNKEEVRLKKYLYVLPPLLACDWVEKHGTMAPMEFHLLLDDFLPNGATRKAIDVLLKHKMSGTEMGKGPKTPVIHEWDEQRLAHYQTDPPTQKMPTDCDTAKLDQLVRDTLTEVWR